MKIQCDNCHSKLTGPDGLAGSRVKCPKCGQAIAVPAVQAAVKPNLASRAGDAAPLSDMLDDVLPSEPALPPEPVAAAALGIPRKRKPRGSRFFSRLGNLSESGEHSNGFVRFLAEHKLVLTAFAVGSFWILLDVVNFQTGIVAILGCVGILLGAGAWRIQSVAETRASENWQWLELWIGRFLLGIPIVLVGVGCCRVWYHYFAGDWMELGPQGNRPMSIDTTCQATAVVGIYIAILVGIAVTAERFGFFRMSSGAFIALFGVLPCVGWILGPAWIHRIDLRQVLQPAGPNPAGSPNGIASSPGTGPPSAIPRRPPSNVASSLPTPAFSQSPARAPATPAASSDLAALDGSWNVAADPLLTPIRPVSDSLGVVPFRRGADVATATSPSPFVAIESGSALEASRELWDLRTARSTKRLSGVRLAPPATLSADGRQLAGRAVAGEASKFGRSRKTRWC